MQKVIRYQIADYLNTGGLTPTWSLMGAGFTALDEKPSAKVDKTAYITDRSTSGTITGYENSFPFNTQLIADDAAVQALHDIAREQKTGEEAEMEYVRAELYKPAVEGAYPARKFRVAVEVTDISGAGTEVMTVAGNLHQVGDMVDGRFNPSTKQFTPSATE